MGPTSPDLLSTRIYRAVKDLDGSATLGAIENDVTMKGKTSQ